MSANSLWLFLRSFRWSGGHGVRRLLLDHKKWHFCCIHSTITCDHFKVQKFPEEIALRIKALNHEYRGRANCLELVGKILLFLFWSISYLRALFISPTNSLFSCSNFLFANIYPAAWFNIPNSRFPCKSPSNELTWSKHVSERGGDSCLPRIEFFAWS